jgi:hypothetical protein
MFSSALIQKLLNLREDVLGPEEDFETSELMTHDKKTFFPPTAFERLGANSVKNWRCYSTSTTHQHPRGLVGPTAGVKVYSDGMKENVILRKQIVEVSKILIPLLSTLSKLFLRQTSRLQ